VTSVTQRNARSKLRPSTIPCIKSFPWHVRAHAGPDSQHCFKAQESNFKGCPREICLISESRTIPEAPPLHRMWDHSHQYYVWATAALTCLTQPSAMGSARGQLHCITGRVQSMRVSIRGRQRAGLTCCRYRHQALCLQGLYPPHWRGCHEY
jgi:hypothetical protein